MKPRPLLVGFDGSDGARDALRWALDDATHRAAPVRLLYVLDASPSPGTVFPMSWEYTEEAHRLQARSLLADTVADAAVSHPAVDVGVEVVDGFPAAVLSERSRKARLVVVGSRRHGGFLGVLVGSVGVTLASAGHCPVVVVRRAGAERWRGYPVVVGVDGSPESELALAVAFDEAAARGVGLVAVRAWAPQAHDGRRGPDRSVTAELAESMATWEDKYPAVPTTTRLVKGDARDVLTAASGEGQLIVVGHRGTGGFTGLALGSVSHHLLQHAACPVAVARPPA